MIKVKRQVTTVQISVEARLTLEKLAQMDRRSATAQNDWLIFQEWEKRVSQPNPRVTVEEAESVSV
jgi:hypothetical protein